MQSSEYEEVRDQKQSALNTNNVLGSAEAELSHGVSDVTCDSRLLPIRLCVKQLLYLAVVQSVYLDNFILS